MRLLAGVGVAAAAVVAATGAAGASSERAAAVRVSPHGIAAGGAFTCALTSAGRAKCWGDGLRGELGDGFRAGSWGDEYFSSTPVDVVGLGTGVKAIAAGERHACAITRKSSLKCWGYNQFGELGKRTREFESAIPVSVPGFATSTKAVAAGVEHTCALTSAGGVKCWGYNRSGQLGNGSGAGFTQVAVSGLGGGVRAITAGAGHSCALTSAGGVKCWGDNSFGQLGDGTTRRSSTPVDVKGLERGVRAIAAGSLTTCVVTSAGGAKCWGGNTTGVLGNESLTLNQQNMSSTPVDVTGLATGITAIALDPVFPSGSAHACALTNKGGVKCWGGGATGDGSPTSSVRVMPVNVAGLATGVTAIAAGGSHSCALMNRGGVKCWGGGGPQLGNGVRLPRPTPDDVLRFADQTIVLQPSKPAGTIAQGAVVTFTAAVRPLRTSGSPAATVRFEVCRQVNGAWRVVSVRDVTANATGRATLPWTFSAAGSWYVRARALADATYGASAWSSSIRYRVR